MNIISKNLGIFLALVVLSTALLFGCIGGEQNQQQQQEVNETENQKPAPQPSFTIIKPTNGKIKL